MARKTKGELPSGSIRRQVFVGYEYLYDPDGNPILDEKGKPKKKRKYESFTAQSKKEAEYMASVYAHEKKTKKKLDITFGEALTEYIETKKNVLSPSTIKGYTNIKQMLKKDYDWFYYLPFHKLSQTELQKLANELAETKSPKTCRNYHGLITAVLNHIGADFNINTTLPQRKQSELYIPTDEEIKKLVKAVKGTELEIPVLLAAFCMMRRGEICALSVKNDIKGNVIHVKHSLVLGTDKQWHMKAPKTESSDRYVIAPDFVIKKIKKIGHITTYNPHSLTISFERILKKNNINHFRFHDLRHYSASVRHALGIPDAYIMADGGWSSDRVLKTVYRHAMSDRRTEMSNAANNHFSKMIGENATRNATRK